MQLKLLYYLWLLAKNWYTIKSKILTVVGDIRLSVWPLWLMYQPDDYAVKGQHVQRILKFIQPGDIILRGFNKKYLDGLFIPSKYQVSHSGIYIGDHQVIHAVAQNVSKIHLLDFCQADHIYIVRPNGDHQKAIQRAIKYLGTPYDFSFQQGDNALYCFELCAHCYPDVYFPKHNLSLFRIKLPRVLGQCYLDKSFLQNENCKVILEVP